MKRKHPPTHLNLTHSSLVSKSTDFSLIDFDIIEFQSIDYGAFLNAISSRHKSLSELIKIQLESCLTSFSLKKTDLSQQTKNSLEEIIKRLGSNEIERNEIITETNKAINDYWHDREIGTIEIEIANNYKEMLALAKISLKILEECLDILSVSILHATLIVSTSISSSLNQSDALSLSISEEATSSLTHSLVGQNAIDHGAANGSS